MKLEFELKDHITLEYLVDQMLTGKMGRERGGMKCIMRVLQDVQTEGSPKISF